MYIHGGKSSMFTGNSYSAIRLRASVTILVTTQSVLHFHTTIFSHYLLSSFTVVSWTNPFSGNFGLFLPKQYRLHLKKFKLNGFWGRKKTAQEKDVMALILRLFHCCFVNLRKIVFSVATFLLLGKVELLGCLQKFLPVCLCCRKGI